VTRIHGDDDGDDEDIIAMVGELDFAWPIRRRKKWSFGGVFKIVIEKITILILYD